MFVPGAGVPFQRPYGEYVMENVLFKVSYPAEFMHRRRWSGGGVVAGAGGAGTECFGDQED